MSADQVFRDDLSKLLLTASDYMRRYAIMAESGVLNQPGVGIQIAEFDSWLMKCFTVLSSAGLSKRQLEQWDKISRFDSYDYIYERKDWKPLEPYEARLRACVRFLTELSVKGLDRTNYDAPDPAWHAMVALLYERAVAMMRIEDYSGALHACGSMLEALVKEHIGTEEVASESLGTILRNHSSQIRLPQPVVDLMKQVFRWRNREPGAGHGHTELPSISRDEAIMVIEFVRAICQINYRTRPQ